MWLFLLATWLVATNASQAGVSFGDGAISQVLRHVASKVLSQPRAVDLELKNRNDPIVGMLGSIDIDNIISYRNLSIEFQKDAARLLVNRLNIVSDTHVSDIFWLLGFGDQKIRTHLELPHGDLRLVIGSSEVSISHCQLNQPSVRATVEEHWLADKVASTFAYFATHSIEDVICSSLNEQVKKLHRSQIVRFPIGEIVPEKARRFMSSRNATLYYRLRKIEIRDGQLTLFAQLEWNELANETDPVAVLLNSSNDENSNVTFADVEFNDRNEATIWVQDSLLNSLLAQVEWNFEWMNEQIPVTSPVIPPDSREFLSTLCTRCYFQVNVAARGQPTVTATNSSLVLEKRDRVHLQVVNPDRNVTSVFVSFVLTIQAELRPTFDDGTLRTLVQLLDTNIEMEEGAFPKTWAFFMQDLMKGMIMDMLWPELKSAIEELSYGKGVRLSRACGVDPLQLSVAIDEGSLAITSRLLLDELNPERCLNDLSASLPSTSKIFGKEPR